MGLGPVHIGYAVIIQLLLYVHFTLIVSLIPVPSRFLPRSLFRLRYGLCQWLSSFVYEGLVGWDSRMDWF
jgi:hypothetical protein